MPGLLLALTVLAELGAIALSWGLEPTWDTLLYAVSSIAGVGAGALILSRHPRHAVGWLLLLPSFLTAVMSELSQGWGLRAAEQGWPAGPFAEWVATGSWPLGAPPIVLVFLLFPTGRLLDPRWRVVAWLSVAGVLLAEPGWVFDPGAGEVFVDGRNPYAQPDLPTDAMYVVGLTLIAVSLIAALGSAVVRFRRSTGVERQQMKWFTFASAAMAVGLPVAAALWFVFPVVRVVPALVITAWPIAIGVAILRYRLYDVDLVISRTFTYAALTSFVAAVYAAVVVLFGAFAGRDSAWVTAAATLLAAAAFGLLRRRVQDVVDRRFRPQRRDALSIVTGFVDDLRHDRAEPEQVVDALRAALRDPSLELHFVLQRDEPPVDEHGRPVEPVVAGRETVAVQRGGTTLGQVIWSPRTDADRVLLTEVIDAASIAIEMARLRVELRQRLDEVDESRARIAAVADEERRRLERDLHDGAQQRLVSIGLALRHAQHQLGVDPGEARRTLDSAVVEIGSAIGELRGLAHGLRPALLQAGLGPALRELAIRAPLPVQVSAGADRYPPDLEAAAYFVACEGLTNAVKHARAAQVRLEVARQDSTLVVTVADDGVGGAEVGRGSGLTGLSDRVAARGGRLRLVSVRGRGTTLSAELPCVS